MADDNLPEIAAGVVDTTLQAKFNRAMGFLKGAITVLNQLVEDNPDDVAGLAAADVLVKYMRRDLGVLDDDVQKLIWKAMGDDREVLVTGIGTVTKDFGGSNTGWDHEVIWKAIRRELVASYADEDTGEVDESSTIVVDDTIALIRDVITKGAYKKTGLKKKLGIEADEVSQTSWGKRRVNVLGAVTK